MRTQTSDPANQVPVQPGLPEEHIAVAVILWVIVAAVFVVAANAWAMGVL